MAKPELENSKVEQSILVNWPTHAFVSYVSC